MSASPPFVDPVTNELKTDEILSEALPLGKLIGLFVAISLVPFALVFFALGNSGLGAVLVLIGQFILAIGAGIVLLYIIARGIQLAGERTPER